MGLNIEIHEKVIKKLSSAKEPCEGFLYGISTQTAVLVLGLELTDKQLLHSLPIGVEVCGYFQSGEQINDSNLLKKLQYEGQQNPVCIHFGINSKEFNVQIVSHNQLETVKYDTVTDEKLYSQFIYIKCRGSIPIRCEFTTQTINDHIKSLKNQLYSDSVDSKIVFKIHKKQVYFSNNSIMGLENESSNISEIFKDLHSSGDDSSKRKKSQFSLVPKVLECEMFWRITNEGNVKSKSDHAPVCILNKNSMTVLDTTVSIDTLSMVAIDKDSVDLHLVLVQSLIRYLELLRNSLNALEKKNSKVNFETFHYLPEDVAHFVTLLYLKEQSEEDLKPIRQTLHKQLLLDQISPRFRRSNQYFFENDSTANKLLLNPHEGVRFTDNGGEVAVVRGKYQYYHYCQNNMDDNGWGCAYRSLQTLASWFKLQGYVDREVPTFHDIQKCLVDIKDKPSSFLGSRQWIGSTEVSYVLNSLLGVDCKILFVSSGEEMGTKGPELVNHFKTQGSPIMIGGGVLAHTILGVDYNQSTGKLKFLILDPHYTGGEDLHIIQSKGWCGWKNLEFWDKKAYYNMCLPQVPRVF